MNSAPSPEVPRGRWSEADDAELTIVSIALVVAIDKQAISRTMPFINPDGSNGWRATAREVGIGTFD